MLHAACSCATARAALAAAGFDTLSMGMSDDLEAATDYIAKARGMTEAGIPADAASATGDILIATDAAREGLKSATEATAHVIGSIGGLEGVRLTYLGDGNNVCHSLMRLAARFGMHFTAACPAGYEPSPTVVAAAGASGVGDAAWRAEIRHPRSRWRPWHQVCQR